MLLVVAGGIVELTLLLVVLSVVVTVQVVVMVAVVVVEVEVVVVVDSPFSTTNRPSPKTGRSTTCSAVLCQLNAGFTSVKLNSCGFDASSPRLCLS